MAKVYKGIKHWNSERLYAYERDRASPHYSTYRVRFGVCESRRAVSTAGEDRCVLYGLWTFYGGIGLIAHHRKPIERAGTERDAPTVLFLGTVERRLSEPSIIRISMT